MGSGGESDALYYMRKTPLYMLQRLATDVRRVLESLGYVQRVAVTIPQSVPRLPADRIVKIVVREPLVGIDAALQRVAVYPMDATLGVRLGGAGRAGKADITATVKISVYTGG